MVYQNKKKFTFRPKRYSKSLNFLQHKKKKREKVYYSPKFVASNQRLLKRKLNLPDKIFYFMTTSAYLSLEAYKLFSILEMQLSAVLMRAQLIPFFFIVPDLCFYRLVFLNGRVISDPHSIVSLFDVVQLPIFLYQLLNYRQNRFYYYPKYLVLFFKAYWGQFVDYTSDKLWLLSNAVSSRTTAQILTFAPANILLYMSPFRRFSKIYYRAQPERLRGADASIMYTHTVFKLKLFNYILFYK